MTEEQKRICTEIWKSNYHILLAYCKNKLHINNDITDEILAETFLYLCQRIESDGIPDNIEHYLYAVITNVFKQRIKGSYHTYKHTYILTDAELAFYDILDIENNWVEELEVEENNKKIHAKLNEKLSNKEKQLYNYIICEHKPYKEVANIIGCSPSAVKQRKYRLMKKICQITNDI